MVLLSLFLFSLASAAEWAVIVSGSGGYWNYRHQAGAASAYQYYIKMGVPKEHIILFMDSDVVNSELNPFPGELYSFPGMRDGNRFEGVHIDYNRLETTATNVMNVLAGNRFSSKRVLQSAAFDTVYVSFFTYGAPGVITLPKDVILGWDLMKTISRMYNNKRYKELHIFVDGEGTEFLLSGLDKEKYHVRLVSPFTKNQPNRRLFCSPDDVVDQLHIGSCLNTDFSYRLYNGGNPDHRIPFSTNRQDLFNNNDDNNNIIGRMMITNEQDREEWIYKAKSEFLYQRYLKDSRNMNVARDLKEEDNVHRQIARYNSSISSHRKVVEQLTQITEWNCYRRGVKLLENIFQWNEYSFRLFGVIARMCEYNRKAF